ncbi:phosphocholine cytidylyltransferase family protein [Sedimentibacter sp.]|uniref:phosphocholine cytidylyltransferase family protein n=1 Tax=Sedimentibacter sp. TaxID=1960295 RepID=UPI0028B174AB|nr:phosphocholine cytidylyltransferase family protein [Sedimentibacter sp.]
MKALILAAGLGTRLRPITDTRPKSMVEVNGKPIIFKQIDNLLENGIDDIIIVAGYKSEMMIDATNKRYDKVKFIINDVYEITNNMYSAYMAIDHMYGSEFLLMNADVFYDSVILKELIKNEYSNSIVVEEGIYNDENMKVSCIGDRIMKISKLIPEDDAYGVSIDIYKFSKEGSKAFFDKVKEFIEDKKELNQWTEVALNEVLKSVEFKQCPLNGRWMEIDNHEDLKRAENIFND